MALKRAGILGKTYYVRYYYYTFCVRVWVFVVAAEQWHFVRRVVIRQTKKKKEEETSSFKKINSTHITYRYT